jgi:apolipoprotein N-acyltransferase
VLIAGTTRYEITGDDSRDYFNSLTVIDQSAARSGPMALYDKHRLVPFGELPAAEIIPFGRSISGILPGAMQRMATNGFKPGPGPAVIYADNVPPFVAMICYEGLYSSIPRDANLHGRADWLAVISNDAWFGGGMGPSQHYAQNRYRSIETGLPMARAASRGASAIVDGYGREVLRAAPVAGSPEGWSSAYARGRLPAPAADTIYQQRIGIVLFWLTLCVFAGLAFASWRR